MKRAFVGTVVLALGAGIGWAAPANALDTEDMVYAAAHMVERSQVPAHLGTPTKRSVFNGELDGQDLYLCSITADEKDVTVPGVRGMFSTYFNMKKSNSSASVSVAQFASAKAAKAAFGELAKALPQCAGSSSDSNTDPDTNVTYSWSRTTTTGTSDKAVVDGVKGVWINNDYSDSSSDGTEKNLSDNQTVYTLAGNAIVATNFYDSVQGTLTKKQAKGLAELAVTASERWQGHRH